MKSNLLLALVLIFTISQAPIISSQNITEPQKYEAPIEARLKNLKYYTNGLTLQMDRSRNRWLELEIINWLKAKQSDPDTGASNPDFVRFLLEIRSNFPSKKNLVTKAVDDMEINRASLTITNPIRGTRLLNSIITPLGLLTINDPTISLIDREYDAIFVPEAPKAIFDIKPIDQVGVGIFLSDFFGKVSNSRDPVLVYTINKDGFKIRESRAILPVTKYNHDAYLQFLAEQITTSLEKTFNQYLKDSRQYRQNPEQYKAELKVESLRQSLIDEAQRLVQISKRPNAINQYLNKAENYVNGFSVFVDNYKIYIDKHLTNPKSEEYRKATVNLEEYRKRLQLAQEALVKKQEELGLKTQPPSYDPFRSQ